MQQQMMCAICLALTYRICHNEYKGNFLEGGGCMQPLFFAKEIQGVKVWIICHTM